MASSASSKSKSRSHCSDMDIISTLPDEILSRILSFLPTKYAVLTSILSTRWRNIWTLVPTLDFDDSSNPDSQNLIRSISFMKFVDRVLILRNSTTCIQQFNLTCRIEYSCSQFNTWIAYVIACGVRDLSLSYRCPTADHVHLPRSLFTCEMLEVLKLNMDFRIHIPDLVRLPSLRVLHLISLPLLDDSSINDLINSCPVLEELVIEWDKNDSIKSLKICSLSLKSLKIHTVSEHPDYDCSLSIDTPCLEYLDISEFLSGPYHVSKLSSVVKAKIDLWLSFEGDELHHDLGLGLGLGELLRGICNVKHLTISTDILWWISPGSDVLKPTFFNLTHLKVNAQESGFDHLPELLSCTSELTNLVIDKVHYEFLGHLMCYSYDRVKCLSKLEMIEIRGFQGSIHEMEFVRYVLKNSMVLKKMTIFSHYIHVEAQLDALKELTRFPRGSKTCELVFA